MVIGINVHSREYPPVGKASVQVQFHVASAFEFLENMVIHPAAGLYKRRCEYGKAAALLYITSRSKETFRPVEGCRVEAPRKRSAAWVHRKVRCSSISCQAVHQHHHIFTRFD